MPSNSAEYMREYRARKKAAKVVDLTTVGGRVEATFDLVRANVRIAELEAEVARLKRELASRPAPVQAHSFNSRPFRPVPKHSAK